MAAKNLTAERVRELLDYDPATGIFTRRVRRGKCRAGSVAGCVAHHGYIVIYVDGTLYYAHRLAWLHYYGTWPVGERPSGGIDHVDRDKSNNRIANLRDISKRLNCQNVEIAPTNSRTGVRGVSLSRRGTFVATLIVNGERKLFKHFRTMEEARRAREAARREHHLAFHDPTTA